MVFGRHFSRGKKARKALFRSLIQALVLNGKIITTKAKAKAIIPDVDKLITLGKKGTISARRDALASLGNDKATTDKLFFEVIPAFKDRVSGFTRIVLLPTRPGDNAEMVRLEWSQAVEPKEKVKKVSTKEKGKEKVEKEKKVKTKKK
jgi:large subunit ribosomal protein L17